MKKHIKIQVFTAFCALLLASCEEVIEVDLSTADAKTVIQGKVTDQVEPFTVSLEKTIDFDQPNDYPAVSGAVVSIFDGSQTFNLSETAPGIYQTTSAQKGEPGRTYFLRVEAEGQVFEAASTMPALVALDSLKQDAGTQPGGEQSIFVVPVFTDVLGQDDQYRFVLWKNGKKQSNIFVFDDRDSDGSTITRPLFAPGSDLELAVGDTVEVEMQTVDRATYKYFYALDASTSSGPNASVPANPNNNVTGGALGYFSAHTVQRRVLVLQ